MPEIARLKKQAKKDYLACERILDGIDCGRHMAALISSDYAIAERRYNETMARLREIDPACPSSTATV